MISKSRNKKYSCLEEKNGYDKLNDELRNKLVLSDNSPNENINKFVTWDEFCIIFNTVTLHFIFYYDNHAIYFEHDKDNHDKDNYYFWIEGEKGKVIERKQSKFSAEIVNAVTINGIHLKNLWGVLE